MELHKCNLDLMASFLPNFTFSVSLLQGGNLGVYATTNLLGLLLLMLYGGS